MTLDELSRFPVTPKPGKYKLNTVYPPSPISEDSPASSSSWSQEYAGYNNSPIVNAIENCSWSSPEDAAWITGQQHGIMIPEGPNINQQPILGTQAPTPAAKNLVANQGRCCLLIPLKCR